MKSISLLVFFGCLILQWHCRSLFASTLYGSTSGIELAAIYTVDQVTGRVTAFGGNFGVSDLASDWRPESSRMWGVRSGAFLIQFNPISGDGKLIGFVSVPHISGLAFDATTDKLYATTGGSIYVIDQATAAATYVGGTGRYLVDALSFDRTGNLFGVSYPDNLLVRIDKANGATQTIGSTGVDRILDLAVRPEDGGMFGVATSLLSFTSNLYRINTDTGAATLVGPTFGPNGPFVGISGLAFSSVVPEPGALVLAGFAISCLFGSRRLS